MKEILDPFEDTESCPLRAVFARAGYFPPPSNTVDTFQLPGRLWELVYALAGRRYYFDSTDHLSDRELYEHLQAYLDQSLPDCPDESGWNNLVDGTELGIVSDRDQIWLRYYADEFDRAQWAEDFPDLQIPPREEPPYQRDNVMPRLPEPYQPFQIERKEDEEDDPLGLSALDQDIRIENLKREIEEMSGGDIAGPEPGAVPPDIEEAFLERVRDIEKCGWHTPLNLLSEDNVAPMPPVELTEETVSAKLWELLHNLACRGFYCLHTDHLSDSELYEQLWGFRLREEALIPADGIKNGGWFHDCVGSDSIEDMDLYLRYYADEETRAEFKKDFPHIKLPRQEAPLYHRDWRLPKGHGF